MNMIVRAAAALILAPLVLASQDNPPRPPGPPMMGQERKIVKQFDKNEDGRLDTAERQAAREFLKKEPAPPRRGPGQANRPPPPPGPKVEVADAKTYPEAGLYDPTVLRTFFLEFENKEWEQELADFYNTDVEIPATLTVDGKKYPNVGIHFRGASSYFMVPAGYKRSLNVSMDFGDDKQRLYGYKTLNLLNGHGDSSLMSSVLYSHIARLHIPAPKANWVKVVINGECWGIYVNVQQYNKEFVKENFKTDKGARWKVKGRPNGASGLDYVGDKIESYKQRYQLKSGDEEKAWKDLMALCQTLSQTPIDKLEEALQPILDIDRALWFLALDIALLNSDGYWIRASDYSLYQDEQGKFTLIPHDMNEAFRPGQAPGRRPQGAPRASGFELDPLVGMEDAKKPLRSRLLAVPSLKKKYLEYVRTIASDLKTIGPLVEKYRALLDKDVEADTRKLSSYEAFKGSETTLKNFAERRQEYLMKRTGPEEY
jgi:spore coat protein CotH